MKTMTETLNELRPKRFKELVEQFAQVHEEIRAKVKAKVKARVIRYGNRPRCPYCGEKVGRCVMLVPKVDSLVGNVLVNLRPHEVRGSAASNACLGAL